ncbi:MAG: hypothetical protein ACR5KW_01895 [Wolbachia sp.]
MNRDIRAKTFKQAKFFASVTHKLCTPLNAIIEFVELIKNQILDSIDHAQYI